LRLFQNQAGFETASWKIFSGSPLIAGQVSFLAVFCPRAGVFE
jgi:hypothetical protein